MIFHRSLRTYGREVSSRLLVPCPQWAVDPRNCYYYYYYYYYYAYFVMLHLLKKETLSIDEPTRTFALHLSSERSNLACSSEINIVRFRQSSFFSRRNSIFQATNFVWQLPSYSSYLTSFNTTWFHGDAKSQANWHIWVYHLYPVFSRFYPFADTLIRLIDLL